MSKVTMPEPEAFLYVNGEHRGVSLNFRSVMELSKGTVCHALITTDQAEAYADARVREALEKVESTVQSNADLREWFAGLALQGLLAAQIHGFNDRPANRPFASMTYEMADAMLKARESRNLNDEIIL